MNDEGFNGEFVHSPWRCERERPKGSGSVTVQEMNEKPAVAVLYDADGRPLSRSRIVGFGPNLK